jgi:hypothetical protein
MPHIVLGLPRLVDTLLKVFVLVDSAPRTTWLS